MDDDEIKDNPMEEDELGGNPEENAGEELEKALEDDDNTDLDDEEEQDEQEEEESSSSDSARDKAEKIRKELDKRKNEKQNNSEEKPKDNHSSDSSNGKGSQKGAEGNGSRGTGAEKNAAEASSKAGSSTVGNTTAGSSSVGSSAVGGATTQGAAAGSTTAGSAAAGSAAAGGAAGGAAAGGVAAGAAVAAPVLVVIAIIILIIVLLLIFIGLYTFTTTVPGMMMDKITEISSGFWTGFKKFFTGNKNVITEQNEAELATYLENMGYNLYGYGFGRVEKNEEGEIKKVKDNYLFSYLLADYNTYAIEGSAQGAVAEFLDTIIFWKKNRALNGMIKIDYSGTIKWLIQHIKESVEIDRETKTMTIRTGILKHQYYSYNMDGWSGRYGKPLELLLTLHLATMAPDIPLEIASGQDFDTKVHIELEDVNAYMKVQFVMASGKLAELQAEEYYSIWNMEGLSSLEGKSVYQKEDLELILQKLKDYRKAEKDKKDKEDKDNKKDTKDEEETKHTKDKKETEEEDDDDDDDNDTSASSSRLDSILSKIGLSEAQIEAANKINADNHGKGKKIETAQPYITYVEKAWYRNIYFVRTKSQLSEEEKEDYPDKKENDVIFNAYEIDNTEREMPAYDFEPEEGTDEEVLAGSSNGGKFRVIETRSKVRTQTQQPMKGKINQATKELFVGAQGDDTDEKQEKPKYYIYDGTDGTAKLIEELRKKEKEFRNQGYTGEELSKKIEEEDEKNVYREIDMNKESLTAFAMLQNMKTKDADFLLRDLKELLVELEYFKKSDFDEKDTKVLDWIIPEYKPKMWPIRSTEKQNYEYGTLIKFKTGEEDVEINGETKEPTGFEEGSEVIAPGVGTIANQGADFIEIEFSQPEQVKGMKMYISGFNVDLSEAEYEENEELKKGTKIGTTGTTDITVILRDSKKSIIENVEDYMSPIRGMNGGFQENPIGTDVERWRDMVIDALAELGLDTSEDTVQRVLGQITNESSGDPYCVNDYDDNSSFDCSAGVLQAIAATYNTYKRPGDPPATAFTGADYRSGNYDKNDPRFNGYYCIYACINYCAQKYGRDLPVWPGGGY